MPGASEVSICEHRVQIQEDNKVLEMDDGNGCVTLNATEPKWQILMLHFITIEK